MTLCFTAREEWYTIGTEMICMATARPRYTVSVNNEMFKEIENFRFENRYQTRSEATVVLIRRGLESLKKEQVDKQKAQPAISNAQERAG